MKKTLELLLVGIFPIIVGCILDLIMLNVFNLIFLINIIFLVLWGFLSYKISVRERGTIIQAFLMSVFGLLMLTLVLYQEFVVGEYWRTFLGSWSQMYFLPGLSLVARIMSSFLTVITPWPMYICEWLIMFIISCIGVFIKLKK